MKKIKKDTVIDDYKIKHLEFIQNIIERMFRNSSFLKGWCLTVLFALMTFSENISGMDGKILLLAVFSFYFLDTYSLYYQESFIDLFNIVRKKEGTDFSLKIKPTKKAIYSAFTYLPNVFFYLFLVIVIYSIHF